VEVRFFIPLMKQFVGTAGSLL